MSTKKAIIIGAGPAGLTAAFELLEKTDIKPVIFEMSNDIGGISKTVNYKGNRIDIGGHRFFSKSSRVMSWWENILPIQGSSARDDLELGRIVPVSTRENAPDPEKKDNVFLVRSRLSRIFFLKKFFDYPIALKKQTIVNLGAMKIVKIACSYCKAKLFPIKVEKSLEDFFINRFGVELYRTFFKDYTEKVWGVPCSSIDPEWGAQRIKGLSIASAIAHAVRKLILPDSSLHQKNTETSLIEQFLYPKYGPGQLWEEVANKIIERGGEIYKNCQVMKIEFDKDAVCAVQIYNNVTGKSYQESGDYFFSSMPVSDLIKSFETEVPVGVRNIAQGLMYRDFITVGLLLKELKIKNDTTHLSVNGIIPDNWVYIQDSNVKIGRLQIFNNWSPYMVNDPNTVWLGLEYFCNEGDLLWNKSDDELGTFAINELSEIDIIDKDSVIDKCVIRVNKAYPAYFGTYDKFHIIRNFTDNIPNLFLIGRNGMHKYNNADHSMLTAMAAVDNVISGSTDKDNIWQVNAELDYHEISSN